MCSFVKKPGLSQEEILGMRSSSRSTNELPVEQSEESDFIQYELGIQYNFIAHNGRSCIKIGVMLSKNGWTLVDYVDPDNTPPESKHISTLTPLQAAQKFVDTIHVDLELQPC